MTARSDQIGRMFGGVFGGSQRREVCRVVIERVPVRVVNDRAARDGAVSGLPVQDGTKTPAVRFGHLHPCARGAVLVIADSDGTDRELVCRRMPGLELTFGRQVQSLRVRLAPRDDSGLKPGRRSGGVRASFTVLRGTRLRATLRSTFVGRLVSECLSTPLAGLFHTSILGDRWTRHRSDLPMNPTSFRDAVMYQQELDNQQATPSLFDLLDIEGNAA